MIAIKDSDPASGILFFQVSPSAMCFSVYVRKSPEITWLFNRNRFQHFKRKTKKRRNQMKETKIYICEVCGTQYASKTRCMACEKSHKKPLRIKNCKYLPKQNSEKGYPFRIDVKMEDGEVISYRKTVNSKSTTGKSRCKGISEKHENS